MRGEYTCRENIYIVSNGKILHCISFDTIRVSTKRYFIYKNENIWEVQMLIDCQNYAMIDGYNYALIVGIMQIDCWDHAN